MDLKNLLEIQNALKILEEEQNKLDLMFCRLQGYIDSCISKYNSEEAGVSYDAENKRRRISS